MAMRQGSGITSIIRPRAPASSVYDEFSPISEWKEAEQTRVLLVYLPGYRKEQLKVATEGTNNLRIRGERFVGGRKRSRFQEEYQIPTDSTIKGIHAEFETGILTITVPKINTVNEGPLSEAAKITQTLKETVGKPKDEANAENTGLGKPSKTMVTSKKEEEKQKFENPIKGKGENETVDSSELKEHENASENTTKKTLGNGEKEKGDDKVCSKVENLKKAMKQLANGELKTKRGYVVNVGVAAIVIVALGVYVSYSFGSYGENSKPQVALLF